MNEKWRTPKEHPWRPIYDKDGERSRFMKNTMGIVFAHCSNPKCRKQLHGQTAIRYDGPGEESHRFYCEPCFRKMDGDIDPSKEDIPEMNRLGRPKPKDLNSHNIRVGNFRRILEGQEPLPMEMRH